MMEATFATLFIFYSFGFIRSTWRPVIGIHLWLLIGLWSNFKLKPISIEKSSSAIRFIPRRMVTWINKIVNFAMIQINKRSKSDLCIPNKSLFLEDYVHWKFCTNDLTAGSLYLQFDVVGVLLVKFSKLQVHKILPQTAVIFKLSTKSYQIMPSVKFTLSLGKLNTSGALNPKVPWRTF